jgi:predicted GNAT superfamily acetyltransferase
VSAPRWPDFLVIGAYKSGTTALHHMLRAHPQVFVPARREPSYFAFADELDRSYPTWTRAVRDEQEYLSLFAGAEAAKAVGEVSPEYLLNPAAAPSLAKRLPHVTLLAVLRNPVDRAFSDWAMYRREGVESLAFEDALRVQDERRARGDATGYYLTGSEYAEQVARYHNVFGRTRLRVWLYDDIVRDSDAAYAEILTAIGVEPQVPATQLEHYNIGMVPVSGPDRLVYALRVRLRPVTRRLPFASARSRVSAQLDARLQRPELDPETRAWLVEHFRPDVERLQDLIDRDLSAWLRPEPA